MFMHYLFMIKIAINPININSHATVYSLDKLLILFSQKIPVVPASRDFQISESSSNSTPNEQKYNNKKQYMQQSEGWIAHEHVERSTTTNRSNSR